MKTIKATICILLFCGAQTSAQTTIWGTIRQSLPKIDSPFVRQMGFQGHNMVVVNNTSFFCQLYAGSKKLAMLPPGGIAFDQRAWQNMPFEQIPMAALCYWDENSSRYAGAAGNIFYLQSYYQQALQWIIRTSDVRGPDGNYFRGDVLPRKDAAVGSRKIRLPRAWYDGALGLQVINNTLFTARIFINGIHVDTIDTGSVNYQNLKNYSPTWSRWANLTIVFEENGRIVGSYGETLYVQPYGVWARQLILGPEYIRRY